MSDVSVTSAALSGFAKDLADVGRTMLTNVSKISSGIALPGGTSGTLATLTPALQGFQDRMTALGRQNHDKIQGFGTDLNTTVQGFQQLDTAWARAVTSAGSSLSLPSLPGTVRDIVRFTGMQSLDLPQIDVGNLTLKTTVSGAHDIISIFDDRLSRSIGIKPAEQYLAPLIGDWENLQTIGQRIWQLSISDSVTAGNLHSGSQWLTSHWTGAAADSYATAMNTLQTAISGRGTDLDTVAKTLRKGGECLERLVYNQAVGLASGLMEPLNLLGFSLPVGAWAQVVDRRMSSAVKDQITAKINTIRAIADTRNASITDLMDHIRKALAYEPGTAVTQPTGDLFEPQSKVVADLGTLRYGYKNNVWWESSLASAF
ncbi:hypothetical protein [Nocardia macrotermitis]|uniref:Uncharacterized protein n=1 Tax=Nocardia macrotermitis TaxID=2585198 RepID=A0A7K0D3Y1_9NOCA|nr:hypothetical protein [Nocardia macrotermitis]MQY20436.1 hypothetical protein [Nocardia macrotermitis]